VETKTFRQTLNPLTGDVPRVCQQTLPPEPNLFCADRLLLPNTGCTSDPNCQCPPASGGHGGSAVAHVGPRRRQDMVLPILTADVQTGDVPRVDWNLRDHFPGTRGDGFGVV